MDKQQTRTVLSGIRATGRLHFGNLMGAVRHFVAFQGQPDTRGMYFIADWHTLTTLRKVKGLQPNLRAVVKDYLAAGLDPDKSVLYAQSSVPETVELMWYLANFISVGELDRVPTFKELVRKNPDNVTHGLLSYPTLMAADILGPKATIVPVGEDQVPNVELARDIAKRFNTFTEKDFFPIPKMMDEMVKVPGLDGEKMGKSDSDNAIDINDPLEVIRQRYLHRGVTDPNRKRREDPGDPYNECRSVYPVHEMITEGEQNTRTIARACMAASIGCTECKELLVESIGKVLLPFQEKRRALEDKDSLVEEVLSEGGRRARSIIAETVGEVRELMGIRIY